MARTSGKGKLSPEDTHVHVRIPKTVFDEITKRGNEEGRTGSQWVRTLIYKEIMENPDRKQMNAYSKEAVEEQIEKTNKKLKQKKQKKEDTEE